YHLLLAGASWMAEYGDPDNTDDWAFISQYSPYQNTDADGSYPPILIAPSTTTRTSRAATAVRPTTRRSRSSRPSPTRSCGISWPGDVRRSPSWATIR